MKITFLKVILHIKKVKQILTHVLNIVTEVTDDDNINMEIIKTELKAIRDVLVSMGVLLK